jgi:hypothetical protein
MMVEASRTMVRQPSRTGHSSNASDLSAAEIL